MMIYDHVVCKSIKILQKYFKYIKSLFHIIYFSLLRGASICNKCWPLMTIAMKVIDKALEGKYVF